MQLSLKSQETPSKASTLPSSLLNQMLDAGQFPPVLLFAGPSGSGKMAAALAFAARLMHTEHPQKHPDWHLYLPEGKTLMHTMETMHELIAEVALPPFVAPYKVFVIADAERMPAACSNALLKTLEEPAERTLFILLSTEPEALLSTITSRCRKLIFQAPGNGKDEQQPALLVDLFNAEHVEERIKKLSALEGRLDECSADELLEQFLFWIRDVHLLQAGAAPELLYYKDNIKQLEHFIAHHKAPLPSLEKAFDAIEQCRFAMQHNVKRRVALEQAFLLVMGA